jgi:pyruvate ferredoxin oxidoreductase delta subunit
MKTWDITGIENWGWTKQPLGGVIPTAGNAVANKTGGWRTAERPVWNEEKCTQCLICWINCPDTSIRVKDEKWDSFDYEHCKGCGICAKVCPADAITMEAERGEE